MNAEWFQFAHLLNLSPYFHLSLGLIICTSADAPSDYSRYPYPLHWKST